MTNRRQFGVFLIVALLVGAGLPAEESSSSWEVAFNIRTAVRAGIMGEHVYSGDDTISYLEWELLPLVTVGPRIRIQSPWGTTFTGALSLPVTRRTGSMTNSDYEDPTEPLRRTRVSDHDALVDSYRSFDVALSQRLFGVGSGALFAGVGYRDRFVKMISQDGTYDYGAAAGDVTGVPITYQQYHRIPYFSVTTRIRTRADDTVLASVSVAPYVFVDALDHHHRRLLDFHDTVRGALWVQGELGISLALWGRSIEILAFGELIPETKGDTYTVDYGTNSFEGVTSPTFTDGAGISWWNAGVAVSVGFGL